MSEAVTNIPFNRPYMTNNELTYIAEAHSIGRLAGDGLFSRKCQGWLEKGIGCHSALLTHSCTAALEMAALLLNLQPGDEVIMPSYTFVSTANAFVLRGAVPVFVDIRKDTLNIDEQLIEAAITPRTKAIVPVHYAGVSCDMDKILAVASSHGIAVVEDAAQGIMASYKGRALGSMGAFGALSFHETKNIICGEGGALLVNDPEHKHLAEMIREKGTDRSRFFRGEVDKYTWQTIGSSFLSGELVAAFLWGQMEHASQITQERLRLWETYHVMFASLEEESALRRPIIPEDCTHNAHMYYILLPTGELRDKVMFHLKAAGISSVIHYVPLHSSPAGNRFGRAHGKLENTDNLSSRLLRLPMWVGLSRTEQEYIADTIGSILKPVKSLRKLAVA